MSRYSGRHRDFPVLSRHTTLPAPLCVHWTGSPPNPIVQGFLWMLHCIGVIDCQWLLENDSTSSPFPPLQIREQCSKSQLFNHISGSLDKQLSFCSYREAFQNSFIHTNSTVVEMWLLQNKKIQFYCSGTLRSLK